MQGIYLAVISMRLEEEIWLELTPEYQFYMNDVTVITNGGCENDPKSYFYKVKVVNIIKPI